ncbi:MAG: hypothetical protein ABL900_16275, partial [Burkholderiaceae bacterium]
MSASQWRRAMNSAAAAAQSRTGTPRAALAAAAQPAAPEDPYPHSDAPRWLKVLWQTLAPRHVFVLLGVLLYPLVATPFFTFQVGAQALVLGLIALSLTFLG